MVAVLRKEFGGLCTSENCAALERLAMVEGESASIPWTHISHEELTYLL